MDILTGSCVLVASLSGLIFTSVVVNSNGHITDQCLQNVCKCAQDSVDGYFGDDRFIKDASENDDEPQYENGYWIEGPKSSKARNSGNELQHMLFDGIEQIKLNGQKEGLSPKEIEEKQVDFVAQAIDKYRYTYWEKRNKDVEPIELRRTLEAYAFPTFRKIAQEVEKLGRPAWSGTLEDLRPESFESAISWLEENSDLSIVSSSDIKRVLKSFLWSMNDKIHNAPRDLTKKYNPMNPERYVVQVHGEEWRNAKINFTYNNTRIWGIERIDSDGHVVTFGLN